MSDSCLSYIGADAAELNAHVLNFVNRLTGLFNQHTKDGRITAIVVELQSRVEHLLHGRLNTVLLLVARADAERPLREQPRRRRGTLPFLTR